MEPDDVEQSLDTSNAVDKYVIPGYKNGIGKPTIIAQLIRAGFDKQYAVEVVDRYEPSPGRSTAPGKSTRIDCPYCGAKSIYVTQKGDFAIGWFLLFPVYYLIYHFVFKQRGGGCSNCLKRLPREIRLWSKS